MNHPTGSPVRGLPNLTSPLSATPRTRRGALRFDGSEPPRQDSIPRTSFSSPVVSSGSWTSTGSLFRVAADGTVLADTCRKFATLEAPEPLLIDGGRPEERGRRFLRQSHFAAVLGGFATL
jgi:hypothetical protein